MRRAARGHGAYFNPVGKTTDTLSPADASSGTYATAQVSFVKERGEAWFTDQKSGFYIVRFTNGVWPFTD